MISYKSNRPFRAILYDEKTSKNLNLTELNDYINEKIPTMNTEIRNGFIRYHLKPDQQDALDCEVAKIKVREMNFLAVDHVPLPGEVRFEKRILDDPDNCKIGVIYDGFELQRVFRELIHGDELDLENIHIVFTNRLIATLDENDRRYHARVIICGHPSIISTTGIVEAPAKPRDFYRMKMGYNIFGMNVPPTEVLKQQFQDRFIDYDDPRLTEVMKGYIMQAIVYHITGEAFCNDRQCRLFNAHWQEEVIEAQMNGGKLCDEHVCLINEMREWFSTQ